MNVDDTPRGPRNLLFVERDSLRQGRPSRAHRVWKEKKRTVDITADFHSADARADDLLTLAEHTTHDDVVLAYTRGIQGNIEQVVDRL